MAGDQASIEEPSWNLHKISCWFHRDVHTGPNQQQTHTEIPTESAIISISTASHYQEFMTHIYTYLGPDKNIEKSANTEVAFLNKHKIKSKLILRIIFCLVHDSTRKDANNQPLCHC